MDDKNIKAIKKLAQNNNESMFKKSLFPSKFQEVVTQCYLDNNESFEKLFNDSEFYNNVMNEMAKELYKRLRQ